MAIPAQVVQLSAVKLNRAASAMRERKTRPDPEAHRRRFPDYEWHRLSYVMSKLSKVTGALLDVGPGRGYFSTMASRYGKFSKVFAADIVDRTKVLPKEVDFHLCSIEALAFEDKAFEAVVCMEVLEHLDDATMNAGLANLRRMCGSILLMAVPFNEPLPLPEYHRQQFNEARLKELFPTAKFSLLMKEPVTRVPWILIEERM